MHRRYIKEEKKEFARHLRKNMTLEEQIVWARLKNKQLGYKFRRQAPIAGYIADFYCPKRMVIIEIDGKIHNRLYDARRDINLGVLGYTILRFRNSEVHSNVELVLDYIKHYLDVGINRERR